MRGYKLNTGWRWGRNAAAVLLVAGMFSCSQVKFVPDDKYLVSKVEVEIDNPDLSKEEAKSYVRVKENYKILGFVKFHLFLYNLSLKNKKEGWFKRIGEPPQIYDEVLSQRSVEQLGQYAASKGYFRANVTSTKELKEKQQKIELKYTINTGERYNIRDIDYNIGDSALAAIFFGNPTKSLVRKGDAFDLSLLEKQQDEIVKLFRNRGYYYFSKDEVRYLADTSAYSKQVLLDLNISPDPTSQIDSGKVFSPYYFNNFYLSVLPGNTPVTANRDSVGIFSDTLRWDNYTLYHNRQVVYPPSLFNRTIRFKKGELFSNSEVESSFTALNRLRQFRFVDIQFREPGFSNDTNLLDVHIRLAPLSKQTTSFDIEGTNTAGNFGVAGNVTYQHRNLFRGAEVFQLKFRGAVERLQHLVAGQPDYFNTREFGVESNLIIPKLLGPGRFINDFDRFLPKTVFTLGYNYQRRPEYTRTISSIKFGYDWKSKEDLRHIWNLIDYNKVKIYEYDAEFIAGIQDLYIRSSFSDHLIFAMNYSFVYNNQRLNAVKDYTYVRFNIESSGNMLWALSELFNKQKVEIVDSLGYLQSQYYQFLNTRFAQYVKSDIELSHSIRLDKYNALVGRAFFGIGIPYGNFGALPFEKKYFTGGANGIRAWQVRSLGPGTYKADPGDYPNQTADLKMEANIEYRFNLTGFLEGALFIDAGNIWAINEKDNREGAQFKFDQFYKQFAVGTGTGLRFDFSYFIFRLDLGLKLRDPSRVEPSDWIIGNRWFQRDDLNLTFAIGYPF